MAVEIVKNGGLKYVDDNVVTTCVNFMYVYVMIELDLK